MTKVAILQMPTVPEDMRYWAIGNNKQSFGKTAGEALDSLTAQLSEETSAIVIVQNRRPDVFFTEAQQQQLAELMSRWRALRDQGLELSTKDQRELETLVEAELHASAARTTTVLAALNEA
jgi:hypothetical protein